MNTSRRRGLVPMLAGALLLTAAFVALGVWQVQRMGWKHDLIERIKARVQAAPQAAPPVAAWPAVQADPAAFEYRRLRLEGEFLHGDEALVQAVTRLGAGFWVMTPLRLNDGRVVLVNRGFVPPAQRDPAARGQSVVPDGPVTVTGLLRLTEPGGGFLRRNDPAAHRWHSRDVAALASARGLPAASVAPFFVDADAAPQAASWPVAGLTVLKFSDSHLVYALTWFGLAAMTMVAAVHLLRDNAARRLRQTAEAVPVA